MSQNLGIRLGTVEKTILRQQLNAVGNVTFDERLLELVSRASTSKRRWSACAVASHSQKFSPWIGWPRSANTWRCSM